MVDNNIRHAGEVLLGPVPEEAGLNNAVCDDADADHHRGGGKRPQRLRRCRFYHRTQMAFCGQ